MLHFSLKRHKLSFTHPSYIVGRFWTMSLIHGSKTGTSVRQRSTNVFIKGKMSFFNVSFGQDAFCALLEGGVRWTGSISGKS